MSINCELLEKYKISKLSIYLYEKSNGHRNDWFYFKLFLSCIHLNESMTKFSTFKMR